MTGNKLRELLTLGNVSIKGLAEKLNMTQPNLSAQFKVQDVKSGILERICEVLGVTMDFFYGGTKYMKNGAEGGCHGRKAFDLQCTRNSEVAHIFMPAVPRGGKAYGNPRI